MNAEQVAVSLSPQNLYILYLGPLSGTCLDRAHALRRLGHRVDHIDPRLSLPPTLWTDRVTRRLGGDWFAPWVARGLKRSIGGRRFDLCYIDGGEWITPRIIALLRQSADRVINYNIDDPLGDRDGARWRAYRQSLPYYDLCVVMRPQNVVEAKALGARQVMHVFRSADEISHAARPLSQEDHRRWDCQVLFLGTWFPERGPFLLHLLRLGVPLKIRGPRWNKAPEWAQLRNSCDLGSLEGEDHAKAIQCARVNLGLLSKGNRDLHTTRSLEIPALGGLLCAERTSEHLAMYEEGLEALFWGNAEECAAACRLALVDDSRRIRIADAGHARLQRNGHYNQIVLRSILHRAYTSL